MRTHPSEAFTLWGAAHEHGGVSGRFVAGAAARLPLNEMLNGSVLDGRGEELRGRSVLIATRDQFLASMALIELDGIARRIVLYPPDLPFELLPAVIEAASVDAVVADRSAMGPQVPRVQYFLPYAREIVPQQCDRSVQVATEWILLTSGTLGIPKLVVHNLASLAGAINRENPAAPNVVWSTFYDIRRYGGLQVLLRALAGGTLLISSGERALPELLSQAGAAGATHVTGTASHWRSVLMSGAAARIAPRYVRLSGEVADQGILDALCSAYPRALIAHAFASTEAGVAFEVQDRLAGFPADWAGAGPAPGGVAQLRIVDGSLRVRSAGTAMRYVGESAPPLRDAEGFVDTGDRVQLRAGRYYFLGRGGGIINVGGLKVHPEEVEAVINAHPWVRLSRVRSRRSPITGAVVAAEVVRAEQGSGAVPTDAELSAQLVERCRELLAPHKVPAMVQIVPSLPLSPAGKLVRPDA